MAIFGDHDNPIQRYAYTGIGMAASVICLGASGFLNWRYGYSLGKTPFDGYIYGSAAAACDAMMAIAPFFFFAAIKNREVVRSLAAAVVWTVATLVAFQSAISHASVNRLDTTGQRAVVATSYQDTRTDIDEARKALGFVPQHRPEATVRAEIEKHKTKAFWSWSSECTEINGKSQRVYCATYQELKAELGAAQDATKIRARLDKLSEKSDRLSSNTAVQSEADPGATTFRWVLSLLRIDLDLRSTQGIMTVLVVVMILTIGGFGPYVSMAFFPAQRRARVARPATVSGEEAVHLAPSPTLPPAGPAHLQIAPPQGQDAGTAQPAPVPALSRPAPRIVETAEDAANNFVEWARRTGRAGREYTVPEVNDLYAQYCDGQNRQPLELNKFREALGALSKRLVKKKRGPNALGKPTVYLIKQGGAAKQPSPAGKIDPQAEVVESEPVVPTPEPANDVKPVEPALGGAQIFKPPFGAVIALADVVKGPAILNLRYAFLDLEAQRHEARTMKAMIRQELHRSKKQRGSRVNRMARAA